MRLTIKEMAKKAGVSVATISRAMNPETRKKLAQDTLERIDSLVSQYGYTPHQAARHLRKTSTKTIGVVFPYVENIFYSSYYTHILAGVSNFLLDTEYQFKMLLLKQESGRWDHYDFRAGEGVEGLIVTQWFRYYSSKETFNHMNVPCIVINDYEDGVNAQFICVNNWSGGRKAAEFLYTSGHRNIAVISGPDWSRDSQQRLEGFQDYLRSKNCALSSPLIQKGDFDSKQVTSEALEKILQVQPGTTAIFCCNDNIAFMVIDQLKEKGLHCPGQISVMGFDDDFRALHYNPSLTTIQMPVYQLAQEAAKFLLNQLNSDTPRKAVIGKVLIEPQLIERQSVKTL